jgi:hypothetical protein
MEAKDLEVGQTFTLKGGNREYIWHGDYWDEDNYLWIVCCLTTVPYWLEPDAEVELCQPAKPSE